MPPFEATVSDGTTLIRVTFDRVATDLYTKRSSRDLRDITGGVIALVDFSIVSLYLCALVSRRLTSCVDFQSEIQGADYIDPRRSEIQG